MTASSDTAPSDPTAGPAATSGGGAGDRWYEDRFPVRGALPARAFVRSDAPVLDLSGSWRFRLSPRADAPADFAAADFDDATWDVLPVPCHWQLEGDGRYGLPAYTNVVYPFPVDPPHIPDENPTGDHRRVFELPEGFLAGGARAVLRFEGVDSALRVWVNGSEVGRSVGSRLPVEFDVTDQLRAGGRNALAVRVHQWSSASYLEDQDMWWLSGIFREVTLLARPAEGVGDVFVHAGYDTGAGTLRVDTPAPARLLVPELGVDASTNADVEVGPVEPWSAESPRLYDAEVVADGERVRLRIGFRTVAIVDGVFTVNGRPVKLRGVNRHEVSPDRGRSVTAADMLADVLLMKRHNVNAVRTSHYPPHPRFLELCDEHGLWVVDECDLETHGFFLVGWRDNPSDDARWERAMVDRMRRTVERDKNHPSVVLWSLGNESGTGANLAAMARTAREIDGSRPIHYEHDWSCPDVDVYSRMYATHDEVGLIATRDEPPLDDPQLDVRRRAMPFVQCEYAHAMGNGPGGLLEYQELFESSDRCMGGFVWEWIDHGLRQRDELGRQRWAYGGDFGEPLHDGNFVADGLVLPDRTPSPGLLDYAAVIAQVRVEGLPDEPGGAAVRVTNRFDVVDLSAVVFDWTLEQDGIEVASGALDVPPLEARESAVVELPDAAQVAQDGPADGSGERWVTVRARLAADTSWADAGHVLALGQVQVGPATPGAGEQSGAAPRRLGSDLLLGGAVFDATTGALLRIGGVEVESPRLDLVRATTDNDRGEHGEPLAPAWRELGLHRLRHRTVDVTTTSDALVVRTRVAPAGTDWGVDVTHRWSAAGGGDEGGAALRLELDVRPDAGAPCPLPRIGVRMSLPRELGLVTWFGRGPGEAYADTGYGTRVGRFTASVEELQTPYVYPQENGNRAAVRWAELTGASGAGLRVEGEPTVDLTVRRWTSEQLESARHDVELTDEGRVFVNLDHAQQGIGTASCGPGVLPPYVLGAEPVAYALVLRELRPAATQGTVGVRP